MSANRIAGDRMRVLRRHIWGYSVCLCPIYSMNYFLYKERTISGI